MPTGEYIAAIPISNDPGSERVVRRGGSQVEPAISEHNSTDSIQKNSTSRVIGKYVSGMFRPFLFGATSIVLLLWVALYNGYPTVYPDTGAYLYTGAFLRALPPYRSPGYSMFAIAASFGRSAWLIAAAQASIVLFLLYEACKCLIGGDSRFRVKRLLAVVCALAALTSLPWEVSLVMPDVFAGALFFSAFLLAFDGGLQFVERVLLAGILMLSVSAHMSLLPIALIFIGALMAFRLFGLHAMKIPSAKAALAWLLVPILAAGLWTASLNRQMGLGFRVSVSGNEFFLGRLFGDTLAADFLRENCPKHSYIACRYVNDPPTTTEQFLFWHPMLPDLQGHDAEMRELIRGTLASYPFRFIRSSIWQTMRQLAKFRTGQEIRDYALGAPNSNAEVIQEIFPRDFQAFSSSRLIRGRLLTLANTAAALDTVVFWLSAGACIALAWKRRADKVNLFLYSAIAFVIINAALCATLVGAYDRYQSRVAWIIPCCLAFQIMEWRQSHS